MGNYYNVKKDEAIATMHNCPISLKFSIELARELRGKSVNKAIAYLNDIMALKRHVPLTRYNRDVAHKKGASVSGVKSGRYPVKVSKFFLKVLNSAISNASFKGLDKDNLLVRGAVCSIGSPRAKLQPQGKKRLRASRGHSVNIEVVVKEAKKKKSPKTSKVAKTDKDVKVENVSKSVAKKSPAKKATSKEN